MSNGRTRQRRRGRAAPAPRPLVPSLSTLGINIDDPLGTRRIVREMLDKQLEANTGKIVAWMDAHIQELRGLATPLMIARIRRNVPASKQLSNLQLEGIIRDWANMTGRLGPRKKITLVAGQPVIPPARERSFADSKLAKSLESVLSIPTSVELANSRGRLEVGLSGGTAELTGGAGKLGTKISWGGTVTMYSEAGGSRFETELSRDHWRMTLSIPGGTPAPNLTQLKDVFQKGERGLRGIARETASFGSIGEISAAVDAISPHLDPVKKSLEAIRGVAEKDEHPVSIGIQAEGPGPDAAPDQRGRSIGAFLTIRF
jgi:hypothetical protein